MIRPKLIPARNEFSGVYELELSEEVPNEPTPGIFDPMPPFFSFNGADIPWLVWKPIYQEYDPIVLRAALPHDWGYLTHHVPREIIDEKLRLDLIQCGVPRWKADLCFEGVSKFGNAHWENSIDDLKYIDWLKQKLVNNDIDPKRYNI